MLYIATDAHSHHTQSNTGGLPGPGADSRCKSAHHRSRDSIVTNTPILSLSHTQSYMRYIATAEQNHHTKELGWFAPCSGAERTTRQTLPSVSFHRGRCVSVRLRGRARCVAPHAPANVASAALAYTRYAFTCFCECKNQSSLYYLHYPHYCKTFARLLCNT